MNGFGSPHGEDQTSPTAPPEIIQAVVDYLIEHHRFASVTPRISSGLIIVDSYRGVRVYLNFFGQTVSAQYGSLVRDFDLADPNCLEELANAVVSMHSKW